MAFSCRVSLVSFNLQLFSCLLFFTKLLLLKSLNCFIECPTIWISDCFLMTTFMLNSFDKSTTQVMLSTSHFIALRGIYVGLIIDDTKFDHLLRND